MSGSIDLHTHTTASDGVLSPEALVEKAAEKGLAAIAVSDHDAVEGVAPAQARAAGLGVEVVPAVELTAYEGESELHVLGYFIDAVAGGAVARALAEFRRVRRERVERICKVLAGLGAPLEPDAVYAIAGAGAVGRPHVARALLEAGHVSSLKEAFDRFLADDRPACLPKMQIAPARAIEVIHEAGGLAVWAHPGMVGRDELVPALVRDGLDGLEAWHTHHSGAASERYLELARRHGLVVSGGSDFHGFVKEGAELGRPEVGVEVLEALREAHRARVGA